MEYVADRVYYCLKEAKDTTSLETLLKHGLNPDNVFVCDRYPEYNGKTFLQIVCSDRDYAKIQLLIKYGCNVNYGMKEVLHNQKLRYEIDKNVDNLTRTCLYYAVCISNVKLVEILMNAGADVSIKCRDKMTALMHAVDSNNLEIVKLLTKSKKCDINAQDVYGLSALHIAVIHGYDDIVEYLLERRARVDIEQCQGGTPLFMVSSRRTLGLLLRYGSDPNHSNGRTVSVLACIAMKTKDAGCILDLLDAGCKVTRSFINDIINQPPAILTNNPEIFDQLKSRADEPQSLKLQTVTTIRKALLKASDGVGLGVFKRVNLLPLPRLLREYIRDLGLDFDSAKS